MKRVLLVMSIVAVLTGSLFAMDRDIMKPGNSIAKAIQQEMLIVKNHNSRAEAKDAPAFTISTNPVALGANFNDYFPASYCTDGIVKSNGEAISGHWITYHSQQTSTAERRVYYALVGEDGNLVFDSKAYGRISKREGFPSIDVTPSGRPILSFHVQVDTAAGTDSQLECILGYDGVMGAFSQSPHSNTDYDVLVDNPVLVSGYDSVNDNEFIWPTVKVGPSPVSGKTRAYIMAKNAVSHVTNPSENVVIYFKDFTDPDDLDPMIDSDETLSSEGWTKTSIPELDEWNNAGDGEFRRPFLTFEVIDDCLYYIGTHIAKESADENSETIDEPTMTVFKCDNYGEGTWSRLSAYKDIHTGNPNNFATVTGDHEGTFDTTEAGVLKGEGDVPVEDAKVVLSHAGPSHTTVGVDNLGRIHNISFYQMGTTKGGWYPGIGQIVKDVIFDPSNNTWYVNDISPRAETSELTVLPTDAMLSMSEDGMTFDTNVHVTTPFDRNNDGIIDTVVDDGTYDGQDDGSTNGDDYWGKIAWKNTQWTYQYHDEAAMDNAMTFQMSEGRMTDANEKGMMVACWPATTKTRNYIKYPSDYPENEPYADQVEYNFVISGDNGNSWSEPFVLTGAVVNGNAVVPELEGKHLSFMYMATDVKVVAENEDGSIVGRISLMYLNDNNYGSSVQNVGQAGEGQMEYITVDITWPAGTENIENNVPSLASVSLNQNYPNPFNPTTSISYSNIKSGNVTLDIYNVKGQLVKTLVNQNQQAGSHKVTWNGKDNSGAKVSSGVYFYKVSSNGDSQMKKMVLMK